MIYYNTELFRKAGIDEFPKTMEDFVRDARKLTGQGQYGYGLIGANDATFIGRFLNFLYAFHGISSRRRQDGGRSTTRPGWPPSVLRGPAPEAQGGAALRHRQQPQ